MYWGLDHEDSSVPIYLSWLQEDRHSVNATVNNKCGLFISTSYPSLAATPDGWVNDPTATSYQGLVEFKNPYAYRNLTLEDAITTKKCECLTINNGYKQLKRAHSYYYQVQMAMFCTRRELVHRFLYSTFRGNVATRWGLDREDSSVPIYLSWLHEDRHSVNAIVNNKCGLVISTSYPWLAATPDGWKNDPTATPCQGLVEFKNPMRTGI